MSTTLSPLQEFIEDFDVTTSFVRPKRPSKLVIQIRHGVSLRHTSKRIFPSNQFLTELQKHLLDQKLLADENRF